jgi:hypothetical protein
MSDLSIIIVNYKTPHLTLQCIQSLYKYEPLLRLEIIVVDNRSDDGLEELLKAQYSEVKWIQMGYNSGFARANNAGWKVAKASYILALNSDTRLIHENTLKNCLLFLKSLSSHQQKVIGCRLLNKDKSYQETLRLEFPGIGRELRANPLYIFFVERLLGKRYKGKALQKQAHYLTGEVKWINGAFWLFHRSIIDKKIFMDEDFFLYGEDVEWCYRLQKNGYQFWHYHEQELIHLGSASSEEFKPIKNLQVLLSDYLFILKSRGYLYFSVLICILFFTNCLDEILYRLARIRNKTLSINEKLYSIGMRKIRWHLIKKYIPFLIINGPSSNKYFTDLNCYEKDKGFTI